SPPCHGGSSGSDGDRWCASSASTVASAPRSSGTPSGTGPSAVTRRPRATIVRAGRRPTNDHRPHRSCSTDSSRKPGSSPTRRRNAATGVVRSASTSRHTGTTVCSRASAWKSALLGLLTERSEEAAVRARVARTLALLLDDEEKDVAGAVVAGGPDVLPVARRVALAPHLLAAARPEHRASLGQRLAQRRLVHPRHHQHLAGALLLHDGRHEPVVVVLDGGELLLGGGDGGGDGHGG